MVKKTAYEQLLEAGLVKDGVLTQDEVKVINKMSDEEVKVLVKLASKLGPAGHGRHEARPDFPL